MKNIIITLLLLFSCGIVMSAQNAGMTYERGSFFINGSRIDPSQMESVIGTDVYNDTYVGAMKQRIVAKRLCVTGACVAVAGLTSMLLQVDRVGEQPDCLSTSEAIMLYAGCTALVAGCVCIDVGIPFGIIGSSRLHWIAEDYNNKSQMTASVRVGLQPHGVGLMLTF